MYESTLSETFDVKQGKNLQKFSTLSETDDKRDRRYALFTQALFYPGIR